MENRPNPDDLLDTIKRDAKTKSESKLRVFLGMSAGVGKTYAMLSAAHQKLKEGRQLVIGIAVTHGRSETDEMAKNIPTIPLKKILYKGVALEELDIDEIIKQKPQIVIIDELAHSNVPGSRHPKRWQDVLEILENGIDVFTAVNIQHIESRKDDVEIITNVKIHETVPDLILDRANFIEVIDIPPTDLLQRLKEGKVYLEDKAEMAAENFFREEKLTALREILFRLSADKVDKELDLLMKATINEKQSIWKAQEKILVVIDRGLHSEQVVRAAKQLAVKLKSPWMALFIDDGFERSLKQEKLITASLDLARKLGASIVTLAETNFFHGVEKFCWQHHISMIVIEKNKPRFFFDWFMFRRRDLVKKLYQLPNNVSLHFVRPAHPLADSNSNFDFNQRIFEQFKIGLGYLKRQMPQGMLVSLWAIFLGGLNSYFHHSLHFLSYHAMGLVFLVQIMLTGLLFPVLATIWAGVMVSQMWNFFFIPPIYQFKIASDQDITLCIIFVPVAALIGILTHSIKRHQKLLKEQDNRSRTLYQLSLSIVESTDKNEVLQKITESLSQYFKGKVAITLQDKDGNLEFFKNGLDWAFNQSKEWAAVNWCFRNAKAAGIWTDTLPHAKTMSIPLLARDEVMGVLSYLPNEDVKSINISDREILFTIASQLALFLQRELFYERSLESEKLKESEKIHQILLNSVSHELKTPLTAISGIVEIICGDRQIEEEKIDPAQYRQFKLRLAQSVERLKQVVENILDMSRLESGILKTKDEWCDLQDIISNTITHLQDALSSYRVVTKIDENFPLIFIDAKMFEQVFFNLMLNVTKYCPLGTEIVVEAIEEKWHWVVLLSDNGPGVLESDKAKIFQKFYRGEKTTAGGTGLGLTIVKSIVELHRGTIEIADTSVGLKFKLTFPKYELPEISAE
jgi:two-component system sensor histidine kinase KdpD